MLIILILFCWLDIRKELAAFDQVLYTQYIKQTEIDRAQKLKEIDKLRRRLACFDI